MQEKIENNPQSEIKKRQEDKLQREFGPVILAALADPRTEDVLLNPDSSLWIKRLAEPFERFGKLDPAQALSALSTIAASRGTVLNHDKPIIETELLLDDSRFEGIVRPVVRNPVFAIRLRPKKIFTLAQYEEAGILSSHDDPLNKRAEREDFVASVRGRSHRDIIVAAIKAHKNILVVGSTGSGKTTFVNAMLDALATLCPDDRVVMIEDTTELQCTVKNFVDLRAVGNVTMLDCLRAAMRLKPHRIVVGEVRGSEAHVLLKAWNTGHPGGAATIHADDAMGGLLRLEQLVAEATTAPQQQLIAAAVNLVVFIGEEAAVPSRRKVKQLAFVSGYADGCYQLEYL